MIRLLIADDHFLVRMGLTALINTQPDMQIVADAENGEQLVQLFREHRPDVVITDVRMPGKSGVDAVREIVREAPDARIIALSNYVGGEDVRRALKAGARAYVFKDLLKDDVVRAIRAVHAGHRHIPAAVAVRMVEDAVEAPLTPREIEVLELTAKGLSNKEIASSLNVSPDTVKTHVHNVIGKLGVSDRTEAVTVAIQRGVIHIE